MKPNDIEMNTREFLSLQPSELRQVYLIYKNGCSSGTSACNIQKAMSEYLCTSYNFQRTVADNTASYAYAQFTDPRFNDAVIDDIVSSDADLNTSVDQPVASISLEDYKKFTDMVQADPDADDQIKSLLLSFIVFYRYNYHPTGWIKYDRKNILHIAGLTKLPTLKQEKLTQYLHTHYNLDMQVVGSNQPIPCYSISWLRDQLPPGSPNNPMITLGTLSNKTIREVVSKLPIN